MEWLSESSTLASALAGVVALYYAREASKAGRDAIRQARTERLTRARERERERLIELARLVAELREIALESPIQGYYEKVETAQLKVQAALLGLPDLPICRELASRRHADMAGQDLARYLVQRAPHGITEIMNTYYRRSKVLGWG